MDALQTAFQNEAADVLENLEEALLSLEDDPGDKELVDAAFRGLHTLKGSGAMVGFTEIERFVHSLENAFDAVRSGSRRLDTDLLSLTLASLDHIAQLVEAGPEASPELKTASDALLGRLTGAPPSPPSSTDAGRSMPTGEIWGSEAWAIDLIPEPGLLVDGLDPVEVLQGLERLGEVVLVGETQAPPPLEDLTPGHLYLRWRTLIITEKTRADLDEALFFVSDRSTLTIEPAGQDVRHDAITELPDEIREHLRSWDLDALRGLLTDTPLHLKPPEPKVTKQPESSSPKKAKGSPPSKEDVVKVPAGKLDVLVDLVGEMVIAQARLAEISKRQPDDALLSVAEDLERMCTEMRDSVMGLRMLPIGTTFSRFRRLVRDVSNQLEKKIQLVCDGEDTELDKTVIDKLGDPMVHLIRNSLDHGIEGPDERVAGGKPETGTIWLSARHSETNVIIEVKDDGQGLDAERIRAKAIERGVIDERTPLTEQEAQELIFAPGFSTASKVSALSGRGVGMDAVKTAVKALRGDISVSSTLGAGTTLQIRLPLTLAIIEGLLVEVGRDRYVLPLGPVAECREAPTDKPHQRFAELRGELVPFYHLSEWLGSGPSDREHQQIVITVHEGKRFGFVVDEVIGQQQTVIKALGRAYRGVEGISGATILGNGEVALILDPGRLADAIERDENGSRAA